MPSKSERQKMLDGELYLASDPALVAERVEARRRVARYNATGPDDLVERARILGELLGEVGEGCTIEPPFRCDYGANIRLGASVYLNFGCIVLDCAPVTIGSRVKFGPSVQLIAATHPIDPVVRAAGPELAGPITIGDDAWLGAGVIVLPGVTIGAASVIGAGSVVTRDIPPGVIAYGNPCRVGRRIDGA